MSNQLNSIGSECSSAQCRFLKGERIVNNWQTARFDYKLHWLVLTGRHAGKMAIRYLWGSPNGQTNLLADAHKLGLPHPSELCEVVPWGIVIKATLCPERDWHSEAEILAVKGFDVLSINAEPHLPSLGSQDATSNDPF